MHMQHSTSLIHIQLAKPDLLWILQLSSLLCCLFHHRLAWHFFCDVHGTTTWKPATYGSRLALLFHAVAVATAYHTFPKQPKGLETRHSNQIVGLQANAWLIGEGHADGNHQALREERKPIARGTFDAPKRSCPQSLIGLLGQLLPGQCKRIASLAHWPIDASAAVLWVHVEYLTKIGPPAKIVGINKGLHGTTAVLP